MQTNIPRRYIRSTGVLTPDEIGLLRTKSVFVAGCGGLGGHIIQNLARMGIGQMTIADSDCFDETNLNRQIFCTEHNLGMSKVSETEAAVNSINPETVINTLPVRITSHNAAKMISGHDIVMDATDNIETRLILEDACTRCNIPLVHGAVCDWYGQAAVSMPGSGLLHTLYGNASDTCTSGPVKETNGSFTPAVIAGIQSSEAIKLATGKSTPLADRVLFADLLNCTFEIMDIF